ncbi:DUF3027 domain-containing protein [Cryobacterium psychrophilum]|uniref:DUF3027 domain-containing protein n=1 Tax=Cryobacterium psychrophilum TaxID=41988 RepID=A0A4Y8KQI1_9MICO|nr:DUF3027 domain-containing protein [Cryobacterium psychrophilum]TDW29471.1 hypothetical protein EDD25_1170 [Cryobacterium psychrophilum]TFD81395.1 DUF3027 domain-containing protein [Cryobacterium psychrophilum]
MPDDDATLPPMSELAEPETPTTRAIVADEVLLAAVDLARTALQEITPAESIGEMLGHEVEGERVVSLLFDCTLSGYPGWHWTVSLARTNENAEPTVLETELMPGEFALTAPDWVPWSDRLMDGEGDSDDETDDADGPDDDEPDDDDDDDHDDSDGEDR